MPKRNKFIPHNSPTFGFREKIAVNSVLYKKNLNTGTETSKLEEDFDNYLGMPAGSTVVVPSASFGIQAMFEVLGFKGIKIGVPAYGCRSIVNSINKKNNKIAFIDSKNSNPLMDDSRIPSDLEYVVSVSLFGLPSFYELNSRTSVIYDFSQSLGSTINGVQISSFAEYGVASLSATKIMTCG